MWITFNVKHERDRYRPFSSNDSVFCAFWAEETSGIRCLVSGYKTDIKMFKN